MFPTECLFDGFVDRYKAHLVAKGFHQRPGMENHNTFSLIVKTTSIRLILSLATSKGWGLCHLDVNDAFLQGTLFEDVYVSTSWLC